MWLNDVWEGNIKYVLTNYWNTNCFLNLFWGMLDFGFVSQVKKMMAHKMICSRYDVLKLGLYLRVNQHSLHKYVHISL